MENFLKTAFTTVSIFLLIFPAFSIATGDSPKISIYYYSSETSINNFNSLKSEFDRYLNSFGPYEFQPFSKRKLFEQTTEKSCGCIALLSGWHFRNLTGRCRLKPALFGVRNGSALQKRVLVVNKGSTLDMVRKGRIASASSERYTKEVLESIYKDKITADNAKILTVPKDIDALMSVGFGMADSALVTQNALDQLRAANPVLNKNLKIIAEGEESLLLVLAVPGHFSGDCAALINIISETPANSAGQKVIRMLGIDGWRKPNAGDQLKLGGRRD